MLLISVVYSGKIDEPGSELLFNSVYPAYWFGLFFVGVSILLRARIGCSTLFALFFLAIVVAYTDIFFINLYTNPIFREIYHPAQAAYVVKYGNVNPPLYPGHVETIAPGIFMAFFSEVTSLDIVFVITYVQVLYHICYALFVYVLLRRLCVRRSAFALLGTLLVLSLTIQPFGTYRGGFAMPLYMLGLLPVFILFRQSRREGRDLARGDVAVLLMIEIVLTLSHHGINFLFTVTVLFSAMLLFLITHIRRSEETFRSGGLVRTGIVLVVIFLSWYSFRYLVPIVAGMRRAITSLYELIFGTTPPIERYAGRFLLYNQHYASVAFLRSLVLGLALSSAWLLIGYTFFRKKSLLKRHENLVTYLILTTGLLLGCSAIVPALYTGWPIGDLLMILTPWCGVTISFLTYLHYNHNTIWNESSKANSFNESHMRIFGFEAKSLLNSNNGNKILLGIFLAITISSFVAVPIVKWGAVSTLVQIPTREIHVLEFMADYLPNVGHVEFIGGVGIGHGGTGVAMSDSIRFIYANRTDLFIYNIAPAIISLNSEEAFEYINRYDIVAFSGYALALNSKYYTDIPVRDQIDHILQSLDSNASYSFVYSSSWPYYIVVETV